MARKATNYIESDRQSYLNVQASLTRAEATIRELQAKLEIQQRESIAQMRRADAAEIALGQERERRERAEARAEQNLTDLIEARKRILRVQDGHQKLSAIVRTALSPDQYHAAREETKAIYPHLHWNE